MTESEQLRRFWEDYESLWEEMDSGLKSVPDEAWMAVRPDNGLTTAQIVEHLYISAVAYDLAVMKVLREAKASDGSAEVRHGFIGRLLLMALSRPSAPRPKKLDVSAPVSVETARLNWAELDRIMRKIAEAAKGKALGAPRFPNPIVGIFKMSAADALAILLIHLRYHRPQIMARLQS